MSQGNVIMINGHEVLQTNATMMIRGSRCAIYSCRRCLRTSATTDSFRSAVCAK